MIKSNDDETIIAMSQTKLVVLTAGSLAFVAAGLWFFQSRFDFAALFVIASKWKEDSEYPWGVGVAVADLVREPSAEKILSAAIHQALMKTVGVVDVQREDADSWIVSGEPSGHDLVANEGKAVVQCIPTIIPLRKPSARII